MKIIRRIPPGHKAAVRAIKKDEPALKFGQIIGFATQDIAPGDWVHEHNIGFHAVDRDYQFEVDARDPAPLTGANFQGYRRANGRFGTRNYLGILTSVNCSATVARLIAREVEKRGLLDDYPEVDGVIPLVHGHGCGMDSKGEGYEVLKRTQWGYAANPNMGAVLMVGLGCETFQIARWKQAYNIAESDTFRSLTIQDPGGTQKAIEAGIAGARSVAGRQCGRRETAPASELMLALQCGGSDGYSGITANPAWARLWTLLVAHGGTAILSETPEIYGAEASAHPPRRAGGRQEAGSSASAGGRLYQPQCRQHEQQSLAGKQGGRAHHHPGKILGAAAKGGTTRLKAVVEYAEPVMARALFMDTPGYDLVSATGQVAGGRHILCFTTGRGSAYGCKPTPSIKPATNTPVYERNDRRHGHQLRRCTGRRSIADKGKEIFEHILKIASGERSKSEKLGYGDAEFVPWQIGATM